MAGEAVNGKALELGGRDHWSIRGTEFDMDCTDAFLAFNAILRGLPEDAPLVAYLDGVKEYVANAGGPDLTYNEVEEIILKVELTRAEKNARLRGAIDATRKLPSSIT